MPAIVLNIYLEIYSLNLKIKLNDDLLYMIITIIQLLTNSPSKSSCPPAGLVANGTLCTSQSRMSI